MAGIGHYGNCVGVATVGGEVAFDPCYAGNPLVNALTVGFMPAERLLTGRAEQPGDLAVLMGAKTGRDGIGGASVLASASFEEGDDAKRPNVQVGDPFQEKLLIEACLELVERGPAARPPGPGRGRDQLRRRRGRGQGRDGHGGRPGRGAPARAVDGGLGGARLGVPGAHAGPGRPGAARRRARGLPPLGRPGQRPRGDDPGRQRGIAAGRGSGARWWPRCRRPAWPTTGRCTPARWSAPDPPAAGAVAEVPLDADPAEAVLALAADPACASKRWVWEQYDRFVGHGTVAGPGSDAAVAPGPGKRPGGGAGHRRQRPLHRPRPGRRGRPGRRRGRPQRRLHRRPADRRHQLPQLRQPRTARGDGLVRGRRRRHGRRLPGPRPARHRRQRQLLQRVVRPPHPPHPGRRRPRPPRGPHRRRPVRPSPGPAWTSGSWARPGSSSAARPGSA